MADTTSEQQSVLSRLARVAAILFVHLLALLLVLIQLGKTVPMYKEFYAQQGLSLPAPTQWVLRSSEFCVAYWFLIILFGMLADAMIVLMLALATRRKAWLLSAYSHMLLLAAIALLIYVGAWLAHPVFSFARPG